jgi:glucose/arabinose dehydrogenase
MRGRLWPRAAAGMAVLFFLSSAQAETTPRYLPVVAFPNLQFSQPLFLTYPPDGSNRLFIVEQGGRILWIENDPDETRTDVALDISDKVRRQHMEEGLLGFAFHPNLKSTKKVYLHYSASNPRHNVLSEWTMNAALSKIDPQSEKIILEVEQPYGNHNGGMIAFGPDGMLYVSLGDGGGAGDPHDNAQNKNTLLGKILRIDVNRTDAGRAYAIPADNPFVHEKDSRAEIWAYGLRNVWRFSFDRASGTLWAGDVGQDSWEEIDTIDKGFNYGWNAREGKHAFIDLRKKPVPQGPFREPLWDYGHTEGQSITGGYLYHGKKWPELTGTYIYGDFMSRRIWGFKMENNQAVNKLLARGSHISSFGEDKDGELYFASLYDGRIYTLKKK